ncbi:MAG TPA: sensor histidine kinase [Solirubrobacteraceae bacterium]
MPSRSSRRRSPGLRRCNKSGTGKFRQPLRHGWLDLQVHGGFDRFEYAIGGILRGAAGKRRGGRSLLLWCEPHGVSTVAAKSSSLPRGHRPTTLAGDDGPRRRRHRCDHRARVRSQRVRSQAPSDASHSPVSEDRPRRIRTRACERHRQRTASLAASRNGRGRLRRGRGRRLVRVVDDGPGIEPALLPHVFEPTVRADNGRRSDRAGLGLTIAARLLNNQGATIDAANAPRRGAILTLRLPRSLA